MVSTKNGEYDKLIRFISEADTIITYNWDILLDIIFGREYELQKKAFEYSGAIRGFANNNGVKKSKEEAAYRYSTFLQNYTALGEGTLGRLAVKQPYDQWDVKKGYFIKAHGSIDWLYCSNEACREYRKVLPVLKPDSSLYCSACHEPLDCLIIPPVLNKGYRNYPLIRVLWNLATIELAHADELVVWGYSLPPTDFYAKWLLRQARQ